MSEAEEDLKATAEAITVDAGRLVAIEETKLDLEPDDPLVPELSAEARQISKRLVIQTKAEEELATTVASEANR